MCCVPRAQKTLVTRFGWRKHFNAQQTTKHSLALVIVLVLAGVIMHVPSAGSVVVECRSVVLEALAAREVARAGGAEERLDARVLDRVREQLVRAQQHDPADVAWEPWLHVAGHLRVEVVSTNVAQTERTRFGCKVENSEHRS
jgi:hypothetical protein